MNVFLIITKEVLHIFLFISTRFYYFFLEWTSTAFAKVLKLGGELCDGSHRNRSFYLTKRVLWTMSVKPPRRMYKRLTWAK